MYFLQYAHSTNSTGEADGREELEKKGCNWLYKGSTAKNSKKWNITSLNLLFVSMRRCDRELFNGSKSKSNKVIFLEFFEYLQLRPLKGSRGPNL
jgi:hypothetical protein